MSKYKTLELPITDTDILREALEEVGGFMDFQFWYHEEAQPLVGYQGRERQEKANFVIPRCHIGQYSNDVGWCRNPATGQYGLIISEYDQRNGRATDIAREVKKAYVIKDAAHKAVALGYTATPIKDDVGRTVKITLRRY